MTNLRTVCRHFKYDKEKRDDITNVLTMRKYFEYQN